MILIDLFLFSSEILAIASQRKKDALKLVSLAASDAEIALGWLVSCPKITPSCQYHTLYV